MEVFGSSGELLFSFRPTGNTLALLWILMIYLIFR